MKENFLIRIEGLHEQDGEENTISFVTHGSFVQKGEHYYISYKESETTGFAGCTTTVKVEGDRRITMMRRGAATSDLLIEKGRRNICHYDTGYGALSLGISADSIYSDLTPAGGKVEFSYVLDMNAASFAQNTVKITVREA